MDEFLRAAVVFLSHFPISHDEDRKQTVRRGGQELGMFAVLNRPFSPRSLGRVKT